MKIFTLELILLVAITTFFATPVMSATSATLAEADEYSILADSVTCVGASMIEKNVGSFPGSSITGFPSPCAQGPLGTLHSADVNASLAQADNLAAFAYLDQGCDVTYAGIQDLTLVSPLVAGTYCSTGAFTLTGNLTLNGTGVWIFKSASTIITSPGSSISGGNTCDIWWRAESSVTLDTTTSFRGNVLALTSITMANGASLDGRLMAQTAAITLDNNVINTESCIAPMEVTPGLPETDTVENSSSPYFIAFIVAGGLGIASLVTYLFQKSRKVDSFTN